MAKLGNMSEAPGGGTGISRGIARPALSKPTAARLGIDKRFPKKSFAKSAVPSKAYRERKAAGIINDGGKNVTPIYKESIPPASVKVVTPRVLNGVRNRISTATAKLRKSGEAAKRSAADVVVGKPSKTIKINSK